MHRLTRLVALLLAVTALLLGPASGVAASSKGNGSPKRKLR